MVEAVVIDTARILLMSRNLSEATSRCAQLTLAGWQVTRAVEQIEVLTAVRNQDIDLVILRVPLEEVVELDLPNVLRRVAPVDYLPVIILADNDAWQQRCRYLDSGADEVVSRKTSGRA